MNDGTGVLWVVLFILVAFSAVFSSSETAFASVNRIRIKGYAAKGNKKAKRVLHLSEDYNRILTAILIGNNIVNIAASALGTVIFTVYFGSSGAVVATVVITIIVLVAGEVIPKSFAKDNAEGVAMGLSGFLSIMVILFAPFIFLFAKLKDFLSKFSNIDNQPSVTEQELKVIVEEIENEGVLEDHESRLVRSALDFDETTADEILIPRVDIISAEVNDDNEEIKELFIRERFSRVPVYEKSIDNIIGILYEKDFFRAYIQAEPFHIRDLLQKAVFIPPQTKISDLLKQIQYLQAHMAVITDQYGGVEGIITLEDVLEELVGEIYDEDDERIEDVEQIDEHTYRINPDMAIDDMFEAIGYQPKYFESDSYTVGGWALELFERIPEQGESFDYEGIKIIVSKLDDKRMISLTIEKQDVKN